LQNEPLRWSLSDAAAADADDDDDDEKGYY